MAAEIDPTNCPHCARSTSTGDGYCVHCAGFLDTGSVYLANDCRMSTADGATVKTTGPVILMDFGCHKDGAEPTPVTVAVRVNDVPGLRSTLLDMQLQVGVRIENGRHEHDQGSSHG